MDKGRLRKIAEKAIADGRVAGFEIFDLLATLEEAEADRDWLADNAHACCVVCVKSGGCEPMVDCSAALLETASRGREEG